MSLDKNDNDYLLNDFGELTAEELAEEPIEVLEKEHTDVVDAIAQLKTQIITAESYLKRLTFSLGVRRAVAKKRERP